jgi:uncharacterized protein YjbJ (UPF0337 family)
MKTGEKDKVKGSFHETMGKIKEVTGKVTGKGDLEVAGNNERITGKIQKKSGQIKTVLGK